MHASRSRLHRRVHNVTVLGNQYVPSCRSDRVQSVRDHSGLVRVVLPLLVGHGVRLSCEDVRFYVEGVRQGVRRRRRGGSVEVLDALGVPEGPLA